MLEMQEGSQVKRNDATIRFGQVTKGGSQCGAEFMVTDESSTGGHDARRSDLGFAQRKGGCLMSERMDAAPSHGSRPPDGGETTGSECKVCSFLEVCEFAYREVANAQLSLSDKEFDQPRVRRHLFDEKCLVCLR